MIAKINDAATNTTVATIEEIQFHLGLEYLVDGQTTLSHWFGEEPGLTSDER
jgi:hypothetical protein